MRSVARVLVIDDDQGTAELLRDVLDDAGLDVTVAANERQIPQEAFDVIITDLLSVSVYTRKAARDWVMRIADRFPRVPIIVVTAHVAAREDKDAIGARTVIVKPFDIEVVARAVLEVTTS